MFKLTIQNRLIAFIVMPVLAFAIMVVTALGVINYTEDNMEAMYADRVEPLAGLKDVVDQYAVSVIDAANKANIGMIHPDEAIRDIRSAEQIIEERWNTYMQTTLTEEEAQLASEAEGMFAAANQGKSRIIERLQQMDGRSSGALTEHIEPLYEAIDPISDQFTALIDLQLREARLTTDEVVSNAESAMLWFFVVSVVAALVLIGFGIWTMRAINGPLARMTQVIDKVEHDNDLTVRVEIENDDEIGRVGRELNRLLAEFEGTVGELNTAITQLASSSEEMSAISTQSSQSMSKQQEQTEMVATAMNEMTATVQEVARNASDAADGTQQAEERAKYGEQVVGETRDRIMQFAELFEQSTTSVERLNEQSEQIGSVIEVISSIADQTNLLALNAAIEAARAGEHGRGFAVVAEEVRSLASRTQNSTVEISTMIEKLQSGVKSTVDSMNQGKEMAGQSVKEAGRAGEALTDISQAVDQVNEMNIQIASAAEEQSAVAEEINQRITAINDVGQETQESASQSAIASQELAKLSSELQKLAGRYRVSATNR